MKKKLKKIESQGYAIVWKNGSHSILEAYSDFEMNDTFSSIKGARMYLKKIFTKKAWPNYQKDIKVVPIKITYKI